MATPEKDLYFHPHRPAVVGKRNWMDRLAEFIWGERLERKAKVVVPVACAVFIIWLLVQVFQAIRAGVL
jgi:hypothetical protein